MVLGGVLVEGPEEFGQVRSAGLFELAIDEIYLVAGVHHSYPVFNPFEAVFSPDVRQQERSPYKKPRLT